MSDGISQQQFLYHFHRAVGIMRQYGENPCKTYATRHPDGRITLAQPWYIMQGVYDMTSKRKGSKQTPFGGVTFVQYKMDKETLAQFNDWFSSKGNTVVNAILETLQDDNKLSLSWDAENDCFIAAMTGKEDSLNPKKCLTVRSKEWFKAQAALAFIHTVVFSGEIWEAEETSDLI